MKVYICRTCNKDFPHVSGKPGRPPVRCDDCREELKKAKADVVPRRLKSSLTSIERVDRLEARLKSQGLHPSQQKER